jgi:hypothetical protein
MGLFYAIQLNEIGLKLTWLKRRKHHNFNVQLKSGSYDWWQRF